MSVEEELTDNLVRAKSLQAQRYYATLDTIGIPVRRSFSWGVDDKSLCSQADRTRSWPLYRQFALCAVSYADLAVVCLSAPVLIIQQAKMSVKFGLKRRC